MLELFQQLCVEKLPPLSTARRNDARKLRRWYPPAVASHLPRTGGSCVMHCPMRIKNRHREMKMRAFANFAFHPNAPAVRFDQVLGDGQTGARPAGPARSRPIDAIKPLKNARLIR